MPKRAAGDQLTGGTRDVNPQYFHGTITVAVAGTTIAKEIALPVNRIISGSAQKTPVMELLRMYAHCDMVGATANVAETEHAANLFVTSADPGAAVNLTFDNNRVIAQFSWRNIGAFTAGGTYKMSEPSSIREWDFTDGAGHGIILATDSIHLQLQASATLSPTAQIKVLYRVKYVSLTEYIGMVQSQQ